MFRYIHGNTSATTGKNDVSGKYRHRRIGMAAYCRRKQVNQ